MSLLHKHQWLEIMYMYDRMTAKKCTKTIVERCTGCKKLRAYDKVIDRSKLGR